MTDSDFSALRARVENGDETAVDELIELAAEHGDMDELRRLADQGNTTAADRSWNSLPSDYRCRGPG